MLLPTLTGEHESGVAGGPLYPIPAHRRPQRLTSSEDARLPVLMSTDDSEVFSMSDL